MIDYAVAFFKSFFQNPSASGTYLAIAIGLATAFGAVWLACYRPPLFKKPWLWAVLVGSAFLTLAALCFIQIRLQAGLFTVVHVEIYVAVLAVLVTAWALWLRWRKGAAMADPEMSSL